MIRIINHEMNDPEARRYSQGEFQLSRRMPDRFLPRLLEGEDEIHARLVLKADIMAPLEVDEDVGPVIKVLHRVYNTVNKYPRKRTPAPLRNFLKLPRS